MVPLHILVLNSPRFKIKRTVLVADNCTVEQDVAWVTVEQAHHCLDKVSRVRAVKLSRAQLVLAMHTFIVLYHPAKS